MRFIIALVLAFIGAQIGFKERPSMLDLIAVALLLLLAAWLSWPRNASHSTEQVRTNR